MELPPPLGYQFQEYFADVANRRVLSNSKPLRQPLTSMEFEVLQSFLQSPRTVIRRKQFEAHGGVFRGLRALDDYVSKLNKKLGWQPKRYFIPVRTLGYRLDCDVNVIRETDHAQSAVLSHVSEHHFDLHTIRAMRTAVRLLEAALSQTSPAELPQAQVNLAYMKANLTHAAFSAELPDRIIPEVKTSMNALAESAPNFGGSYGVLGLISLTYDYNWEDAEIKLQKAIQLNPKDAAALLSYAHLLVSSGRRAQAIETMRQAVEVDPSDQIVAASEAWIQLLSGNFNLAKEQCEKTLWLFPSLPPAHLIAGWAYQQLGHYKKARTEFETALSLEISPITFASLGNLLAVEGDLEGAHEQLAAIHELFHRGETAFISGYCEALIYVGMKSIKSCLDALDRAYDQKCDWLIHLAVEPRWSLANHTTRFSHLIKKVRIPQGHRVKKASNA